MARAKRTFNLLTQLDVAISVRGNPPKIAFARAALLLCLREMFDGPHGVTRMGLLARGNADPGERQVIRAVDAARFGLHTVFRRGYETAKGELPFP